MIVLGLQDGHGAGVALLVDGEIISVNEEERFTRIKGDSGFPKKSIDFLINKYGHYVKKSDYIVIGFRDQEFKLFATKRYPCFGVRQWLIEEERYWIPTLVNNEKVDYLKVMNEYVDYSLNEYPLGSIINPDDLEEVRKMRGAFTAKYLNIPEEKIVFVDHHTCHAHHAYFSSPLRENVLIITMDGFGDGTNATIHVVDKDNNRLKCLYRTNQCNIGRVYQYVTLLLGMKPAEHEYKVMGLAPYAKEYSIKEPLEIFKETYYIDKLEFKIDKPIRNHYQYFKKRLEGYRFDAIAGALQKWTEELIVEWTKNWIKHTGLNNIVFSGGVALNIKVSKCIADLPEVKNIFICQGGGDESLAIGAAQYQYGQVDSPLKLKPIRTPYLSDGFDENDIMEALEDPVIRNNYSITENVTYREIAEILASGEIVAFMTGNMEFGPRALGHRSLLADPRELKIVKIINDAIKNRDFWMPFTPSILEERAADYLVNPKNLMAPYMTLAFDSTERAQNDLAAAIHPQDMTIRPQIVNKDVSPEYYSIIKEFENITGVGALLNTSFNMHGRPIVYKPIHAVEEVIKNELVNLKYIVFDRTLLKKISDI